jgi:hypothetical protein
MRSRAFLTPARRSPKGADGVALQTSRATVMELVRALARAPKGLGQRE